MMELLLIFISYWLLLQWYRAKFPMQLRPFSEICASHLSFNHPLFVHQSSLLSFQQGHVVAKREETGREMAAEFCLSVSLSYLK
jgi:hypothetical protein